MIWARKYQYLGRAKIRHFLACDLPYFLTCSFYQEEVSHGGRVLEEAQDVLVLQGHQNGGARALLQAAKRGMGRRHAFLEDSMYFSFSRALASALHFHIAFVVPWRLIGLLRASPQGRMSLTHTTSWASSYRVQDALAPKRCHRTHSVPLHWTPGGHSTHKTSSHLKGVV